jgi:hypothetical protein
MIHDFAKFVIPAKAGIHFEDLPELLRPVSLKMSFPLVGNRRLFKLQRSEPIPDKPE